MNHFIYILRKYISTPIQLKTQTKTFNSFKARATLTAIILTYLVLFRLIDYAVRIYSVSINRFYHPLLSLAG